VVGVSMSWLMNGCTICELCHDEIGSGLVMIGASSMVKRC